MLLLCRGPTSGRVDEDGDGDECGSAHGIREETAPSAYYRKAARTLRITAAGQNRAHTDEEFVYLGATATEHAEPIVSIKRRSILARKCSRKHSKELHDRSEYATRDDAA